MKPGDTVRHLSEGRKGVLVRLDDGPEHVEALVAWGGVSPRWVDLHEIEVVRRLRAPLHIGGIGIRVVRGMRCLSIVQACLATGLDIESWCRAEQSGSGVLAEPERSALLRWAYYGKGHV